MKSKLSVRLTNTHIIYSDCSWLPWTVLGGRGPRALLPFVVAADSVSEEVGVTTGSEDLDGQSHQIPLLISSHSGLLGTQLGRSILG